MTDYHSVTQQIVDILVKQNCWYQTFEHQPVRTSEEAAAIRDGFTLEQGAKALLVRIKRSKSDKEFVMLVVPGNKKFDKNKVKQVLQIKDLRFATEEEVSQITGGIKPGGVPPWGNLLDIRIIADRSLFDNETIIFNAGDKRFSVAMKSADYQRLVKPDIQNIC